MHPKLVPAGLLAASLMSALPVRADGDEVAELKKRVEELEHIVRELRQARTGPAAVPPSISTPEAGTAAPALPEGSRPVIASGGKCSGLVAGSDTGLRVALRGDFQADGRFYQGSRWPAQPGLQTPDTFLIRRARPTLEATVLDVVDLRLMPEFGNNTNAIYDAYAELRLTPEARVRVGKFKPPVGLEALQTDDYLFFPERSLANGLVPTRDVGVQLSGDLVNKTLLYQVGVFNGSPDSSASGGDRAVHSGKEVAARLFARPFRNDADSALRGLGFGVAYAAGDPKGSSTSSALPAFPSVGQQTLFAYSSGAVAAGHHRRFLPQAFWYAGPVGVMAEYVKSERGATRGGVTRTIDESGWELSTGYVVTGEDATYDGVEPHAAFRPGSGNWGAFQLVARTSRLRLGADAFNGPTASRLADPAASALSATDYGIGLNWYLNHGVRITLSYDQTRFTGAGPAFQLPDEKVLIGRFQVSF